MHSLGLSSSSRGCFSAVLSCLPASLRFSSFYSGALGSADFTSFPVDSGAHGPHFGKRRLLHPVHRCFCGPAMCLLLFRATGMEGPRGRSGPCLLCLLF